jgi:hypothetical protein
MKSPEQEGPSPIGARPQPELRSLALQRVRDHTLPCDHSARLFAGPGQHQRCALCDDFIETNQIDYEVDSTSPDVPAHLHFHIPCYSAWLAACS